VTTRTDAFTGGPQLTWATAAGSAPTYSGNEVSIASSSIYRCDDVLASVDHQAAMKGCCGLNNSETTYFAVCTRMDASALDYYSWAIDTSTDFTSPTVLLIRWNNNVPTIFSTNDNNADPNIGSYASWQGSAAASGRTLLLTTTTSGGNVQLAGYVNGVLIMTHTDSVAEKLLTGTRVGYLASGSGTAPWHLDDFAAQDISSNAQTANAGLAAEIRAANAITVQSEVIFNHPAQTRAAFDAKPVMFQFGGLATELRAALQPQVAVQPTAGLATTQTRAALQPTIAKTEGVGLGTQLRAALAPSTAVTTAAGLAAQTRAAYNATVSTMNFGGNVVTSGNLLLVST